MRATSSLRRILLAAPIPQWHSVNPVTKKPNSKIYRPAEVGVLLKTHDLAKKDGDIEMKTAQSVFASGLYCGFTVGCKVYRRYPSRPWNCLESTVVE